jgi:pimeloyl-ACP methyl ester carboxylesterase/DNA-binding CsgD family transcriptional regulator
MQEKPNFQGRDAYGQPISGSPVREERLIAQTKLDATPARLEKRMQISPTPYIHQTITRDGVRIAYWSLGTGEPTLVILPTPQSSHIAIEWENEHLQALYEGLAASRHIVRFDSRGTGLSERSISEITMDGLHADIEAVLKDLKLERVAFLGQMTSCAVALSFAAKHPEMVSHCLLWAPTMWGRHNPVIDALTPLIDKDWSLYLQARYRMLSGEEAAFKARLTEEAVTRDFFKLTRTFWETVDVSEAVKNVEAKTLVLRRREDSWYMVGDEIPTLEGQMPNAVAVTISGDSHEIHGNNIEETVGIIDAFLSGNEEAAHKAFRPATEQSNGHVFGLSDREMEILSLLAEGFRSKEIAIQLRITLNTVERHIANIYKKTGAHGRAAAVAFAIKQGILR